MNQHDQMQQLREALREIQVAAEDCASGDYPWPHKQNYKDFAEHAKKALAAGPAPTVEPSEDAKRTLANPPERIYLQVGDVDAEFPGEIHWRDVTWCDEQVERSDLVYVRQRAPLVRLTQQDIEKCQHGDITCWNWDDTIIFANAIMDAMQEKNK